MNGWEEENLRELVVELREANLLTATRVEEVEQLLNSQKKKQAVNVIASELELPVHRVEC